MQRAPSSIVFAAAVCVMLSGAQSALAQALLGTQFMTATLHDFVSHFDFKESEKTEGKYGLTEHVFTSQGGELMLGLGVTPDGKIVHMRFAMPRKLIDDPKQTLAGRDLAKSFVNAAMESSDYLTLGPLTDEIAVRGLDLFPVPISADAKFKDSGKEVPKSAYKVGPGPIQKGEQVTFIEKMPSLTKTPSEMYNAFSGKATHAGTIGQSCRMAFFNDTADKTPVFMADAWNEDFWQKNIEPKQAATPAEPADPKEALNHAIELIATKDPVNSRMAERDLETAEKQGSTDFRIPALKALASIQVGRRTKGLAALREAIAKLPAGSDDAFRKQVTATANEVDNKLKHPAPYTVAPAERHYIIPPGTAVVIADRDEATGLVTMALSGGHDPDGGKQDGADDGIIEVPWDNINQPDDVLRAK